MGITGQIKQYKWEKNRNTTRLVHIVDADLTYQIEHSNLANLHIYEITGAAFVLMLVGSTYSYDLVLSLEHGLKNYNEV